MSASTLSASDPLRTAADSFVSRLRRGERPTLGEYTERYPDQATRIRDLFPKLLAAERRTNEDQATGPFGPVEDTDVGIPRAIGDYLIVREIGRGGMGIVYEAVQGSLGRQVALKVLPSGPLSRGTFLERFRREARAAARLHHTNIVPVFGTGDADGIHFYAMQYIEGLGLDSVLKEVRRRRGISLDRVDDMAKTVDIMLSMSEASQVHVEDFELGPGIVLPTGADDNPDRGPVGRGKELVELAEMAGPKFYRSVARLGVQAAEALAYAHSQGVLHRDVKPSNLLLDRYGILWITDFGLAKAEGEDMTGTGDIVGTLRYMAPERFQARSDARSDIYALGMTLYEMIALKPAFDDDDRLRLVERITRDRPASLRSVDPHVPRDLETIILKAIQREEAGRYPTAAEMADDLRRYLADRPIFARRATMIEEFRRWCRRNPLMAYLSGVVLFLLVAVVGVTTRALFELRIERDEAQSQRQFAERMQSSANERFSQTQVATAQLLRSMRKIGQRFVALDALEEARRIRNDASLTSHAIASLALPDLKRVKPNPTGFPTGSSDLDYDPAFERYARVDKAGVVSVCWVTDNTEILKLPGQGGPAQTQFSRMGGYLTVWHERDGRLVVYRLDDQPTSVVFEEPANASNAWDSSDDDRRFAYGRLDGQVVIYDLPSRRIVRQIALDGPTSAVAFRPGGGELAVAVGNAIALYDPTDGRLLERIPCDASVEKLVWHPSGRRLAASFEDGRIQLIVRNGDSLPTLLDGHRGGVTALCFNHVGDLLVSCGADRTLKLWNPSAGRLLLSTPSGMTRPRFSKDDYYLAAEIEGASVALWEVAAGREYRTLTRHPSRGKPTFRDGSISPDGRLFAVATSDGVSVWDIRSGEELALLPLGDTVGSLFLPSGELLTSGQRGVFGWPIRLSDGRNATIGPPRLLAAWPGERLARNPEGNVIAVASRSQGAVVLDADRPTIRNTLLSHEKASYLTVSPDGSQLATGTTDGTLVRIWDASTNRLIHELPVQAGSDVGYSSDGRWLATNVDGNGVQLWAVGVWRAGPLLPAARRSRFAFSPDASLIAVESVESSIRLYRVADASLVAEFDAPGQDRLDWMGFTADGARLVTVSNLNQSAHIWDLAAIRDGLSVRGLDWKGNPLTPAVGVPSVTELAVVGSQLLDPPTRARWTVAIDTVRLFARPDDAEASFRRGAALSELGLDGLALADYSHALRLKPDHAEAAFLRGQEYSRIRQWEAAIVDFDRAARRPALSDTAKMLRGKVLLQLDRVEEMIGEVEKLLKHYPNDPQLYYQRALGLAYRGRETEALADLEVAIRLGPNHDQALNNLAWLLATGPLKMRDPERAVLLIQRAVKIAPQKTSYLNTLGVALYRVEKFAQAAATLESSLSRGRGQFDGYDLFLLSMTLARLDQPVRARECFEKACEWQKNTRLTPLETKELQMFRKEADVVLKRKPTVG